MQDMPDLQNQSLNGAVQIGVPKPATNRAADKYQISLPAGSTFSNIYDGKFVGCAPKARDSVAAAAG
jgi:hypothetical protein